MIDYRIYHRVSNWTDPDDVYWLDPASYAIDGDGEGPEPLVLDSIYARHNRDDRPDGQTAPSLSVGDVIDVPVGLFRVEPFGFQRVPGVRVVDASDWRSARKAAS